jgi:hypothetical protein
MKARELAVFVSSKILFSPFFYVTFNVYVH